MCIMIENFKRLTKAWRGRICGLDVYLYLPKVGETSTELLPDEFLVRRFLHKVKTSLYIYII